MAPKKTGLTRATSSKRAKRSRKTAFSPLQVDEASNAGAEGDNATSEPPQKKGRDPDNFRRSTDIGRPTYNLASWGSCIHLQREPIENNSSNNQGMPCLTQPNQGGPFTALLNQARNNEHATDGAGMEQWFSHESNFNANRPY